MSKTIYVDTPQGKRNHGYIRNGIFCREVEWDNDRMKIFDAWSIHPQTLAHLETEGVKKIRFFCGNDIYEISMARARKKGFLKEFAGGETIYIQLKYWAKITRPIPWICPRCETQNSSSGEQCILCYLDRPRQKVEQPQEIITTTTKGFKINIHQ